jgi:hypothetical protein
MGSTETSLFNSDVLILTTWLERVRKAKEKCYIEKLMVDVLLLHSSDLLVQVS